MEYEDRYSPSYEEFEVQKRGVDTVNDIKKLDRGYNEIYRKVEQTNGTVKNKKIIVYNSGDVGSNIRNAVTGIYANDLVGSKCEDLYFVSSLATGESQKGPLTLYFDSPEQFERHFNTTVNENIKSKWLEKRQQCVE